MNHPSLNVLRRRVAGALSNALFVALHLAALLAFVVPLSRGLLALALGGYLVRMWGITAGYHRYFSHRAFKTSRPFQFVLAFLGGSAMQNGPLWWASWHRHHHKHSDTERDAHSPVRRGFWHAHMVWYLDGSHDEPDLANVKDLARFPELRLLERCEWLPVLAYLGLCAALFGLPGVVWGFVVSTLACLHATMLINSLAHVWGTRPYDTPDRSRNNALLALLTLGEGWHNNHHHCMGSARAGFRWWQIDVTYSSLLLLERLGLVWDLRAPAAAGLRRARAKARTVRPPGR
ncbi:MAG TPA: acyl-CoA desaturase [Polyangiaceae bacterium]|nr:acyl-CoA desaturase [Polyangiaceae bacterium]